MRHLAVGSVVKRVCSRRNGLIGSLLVCVLVALIIRLPASVAAGLVNQVCSQHCRMVQTAGHWWAGSGRLLVRASPHSAWLDQGEVRWVLSVSTEWSVFTETPLQLHIHLAQGRMVAGFGILAPLGCGSADISASELHLPAELLPPLSLPGLPGAHWSGNLRLRHGQWHRDAVGAWRTTGEVLSQDLSFAALDGLPMDPVTMSWMADGTQGAQIALISDKKPRRLRAAGEIKLTHNGKLAAVDMRFDVGPEASVDIRRMLSTVAVVEASVPERYIVKQTVE